MGAIAAAMREFYEHHRIEGRGPSDLRLSRHQANSARTKYHFLAHVESRRPVEANRLAPRRSAADEEVRIIQFEEDFARLLAAASTLRDALLLSVLYDCGLRIGQALGLRHGDLDPMRRRLHVERREDNVNGSLSKQRRTFTVEAPDRTFALYRRYLLEELEPAGVESDYLFVNLRSGRDFGRPCSDGNIAQTIARVGAKAGISRLHPHMLRHTHGTALAKAGWTTAEIAARLGQSHASSADVYIHLASEDLEANVVDCSTEALRRPTSQPTQLCYAHWWQWKRAGMPDDCVQWAASDAKPCLVRPKRPAARTTPLAFVALRLVL